MENTDLLSANENLALETQPEGTAANASSFIMYLFTMLCFKIPRAVRCAEVLCRRPARIRQKRRFYSELPQIKFENSGSTI
jgi:hypothetical protein